MEKINTVLAAIDLEVGSDAVLARAVQLASAHAAQLVVVHAIEAEPPPSTVAHMKVTERALREKLEQQAIAAIATQQIENDRIPRIEVLVAFGLPHEFIHRVTGEQRAEVVVIGPGKGNALKDRLLGSTAIRVVRASAAPVLVVKNSSTEPYRRVAVAIDGSQHSATAIIEARKLVPDATMQLVQVIGIPIMFQQTMLRAGTSRAEMEQFRTARTNKAREELSAFRQDVPGAEALPIRMLDGDEPGSALVRFSENARLDLLALGSRGHGAALQALLGSVARRVLAEAPCDVLVATRRLQ